MRINLPTEYDPGKEYQPGERFKYKTMVLQVRTWTDGMTKIAHELKLPIYMKHKCGLCRIEKCDYVNEKCWSWNRKDRKNLFYGYKSKLR